MKNKKVKISVVATAVALSMTTAVSVGAAVSAQESTGIPNTAMAASSTPTADVVEENGFLFDKSTGTITDYTGNETGTLTIPSSIDGVTVTSIKAYALGSAKMKEVVIPNTIETLGFGVFQMCSSLEKVTFESGSKVTELKDSMFYQCTKLKEVVFPENLKSIKVLAFYKCTSLETVTLPEGFTTLYNAAFLDCTNLKTVIVPDSLNHMVMNPFEGCTNLETLSVPYRCWQFGIVAAEWTETSVMPLTDAVNMQTLYIDQVEGKYDWHEKELPKSAAYETMKIYFRKPTIQVTDVTVSADKQGYDVTAALGINHTDGFSFNGTINTPDGKETPATGNTVDVSFTTSETNYQVIEMYKGYEDMTWDLQIDGFKNTYVNAANEKAIAYLNSETNYYPTLTELGYEDDANFLGWSETEGDTTTVYKPGDLIDNTATVRANNSVGKRLYAVYNTEPTNPEQPTNPENPTDPTNPENPTNPEQPSNSMTPTDTNTQTGNVAMVTPQTGDGTTVGIWASVMAVCAGAVAFITGKKIKSKVK